MERINFCDRIVGNVNKKHAVPSVDDLKMSTLGLRLREYVCDDVHES